MEAKVLVKLGLATVAGIGVGIGAGYLIGKKRWINKCTTDVWDDIYQLGHRTGRWEGFCAAYHEFAEGPMSIEALASVYRRIFPDASDDTERIYTDPGHKSEEVFVDPNPHSFETEEELNEFIEKEIVFSEIPAEVEIEISDPLPDFSKTMGGTEHVFDPITDVDLGRIVDKVQHKYVDMYNDGYIINEQSDLEEDFSLDFFMTHVAKREGVSELDELDLLTAADDGLHYLHSWVDDHGKTHLCAYTIQYHHNVALHGDPNQNIYKTFGEEYDDTVKIIEDADRYLEKIKSEPVTKRAVHKNQTDSWEYDDDGVKEEDIATQDWDESEW